MIMLYRQAATFGSQKAAVSLTCYSPLFFPNWHSPCFPKSVSAFERYRIYSSTDRVFVCLLIDARRCWPCNRLIDALWSRHPDIASPNKPNDSFHPPITHVLIWHHSIIIIIIVCLSSKPCQHWFRILHASSSFFPKFFPPPNTIWPYSHHPLVFLKP